VSPTTADDVRNDLGDDVDIVLDDGPCRVGVESTIVDCTGESPAILRLGGVPRERVEELVGPVEILVRGEVAAPGTTPSHYAPEATVELTELDAVVDRSSALLERGLRVGLLALDRPGGTPNGLVLLDQPADAEDYARVLYARLREADRLRLDVLLAVPPAPVGLGAAVIDRLARAAAGAPVSATP
jgi:L-threonylcarbamoyladenylate synthase